MSTVVINGSGSKVRVASKTRKPVTVYAITRHGVKTLKVNDRTEIKFAA